MDTFHLSCYLTLCDHLSYTAAAEECFISRQAMRQIVQRLEAEYGTTLIENCHNRLSLTPAGALLRQKARQVVSAYAELESAMRACRGERQCLRLGFSSSLIPFYAPEIAVALERFPKAYPRIDLDLRVLSADGALAGLLRGELDAVIVVDTGCTPLPLSRVELRKDPLRLLIADVHPLANRDALDLASLEGQTLDLMSDPGVCFSTLSGAIADAHIRVTYRVVEEYYDVCRDVRDALTLGLDRAESEPLPAIGSYRLLPLENERFALHTVLLFPPASSSAASLLAAYLRGECARASAKA